MKILIQLFCLTSCILLFTTCQKKESHKEQDIEDYCYTEVVQSFTNTYVQMGDTTYHLNCMEGSYCYISTFDKNVFYFSVSDSLNPYQNPFDVMILTEAMKSDIFFQKGVKQIDTLYIHSNPLIIGGSIDVPYYAIRALFTWDTISYENRRFEGKGSLETMDTLYTDYQDTHHCPNTYYPPQKIEFEFKNKE